MRKLLSLPPGLVPAFHQLTRTSHDEWFCTSDPVGHKLGSGGGTAWLLQACYGKGALPREKRILLHAGGQSRRLPAYATSGKVLTPIPVFRWERGQRLEQNLLSLQMPLYEKIMAQAPPGLNTLIASGDVYIRAEKPLGEIPRADVVCYGLWVNEALASHHGVFVADRRQPHRLDYMLQKPATDELERLSASHLFLMDIGVWLLSDRAVELLTARATDANAGGNIGYYDLYSDFGHALGDHPRIADPELNSLSVAILPLPGGEFYHFGTSRELLSSTVAIQNKVCDQRQIMQHRVKPNPAIFVQNADVQAALTPANDNLWIENSCVPATWQLGARQIITGVPQNDWHITVPDDTCIDIVPVGDSRWAVRTYRFDDTFAGDKQREKRFPVVDSIDDIGTLLRYLTTEPDLTEGRELYDRSTLLSADDLLDEANLQRLFARREAFRKANWPALAANYEKSVFYQLDLADAARNFHELSLPKPAALPPTAPAMQRMHNCMLRAQIDLLDGRDHRDDEQAAFALLREGLLAGLDEQTVTPRLSVAADQIVWGRSPVRIDVAGGWTDTPPYSLFAGGNVVNLAIELNGQPPLQVYVKPAAHPHIILRSIDMGAVETLTTYDDLQRYNRVGSPFSIPKAALTLAGFSPRFSGAAYSSLEEQLQAFGSGIELTLLSAIPAGSGLGTSSILASTVLG
ncbi:MAG: bifunctional fucokinase/L-fucose-1-P-guanylyltransferase, partial [Prevotellaceae bacterium]|nr:bifunctional fucokinase/L-fucose-1-P-guanylyltransferase [Prevotellaceae bacterium]